MCIAYGGINYVISYMPNLLVFFSYNYCICQNRYYFILSSFGSNSILIAFEFEISR